MNALIAALLIGLPIAAHAASPEDAYIAARDTQIARFKNAKLNDATSKQEAQAHANLERMLRGLLGNVSVTGVPAEGKSNLEALTQGDMGFGQLDGLVHRQGDDGPSLLVTTPTLATRWLAAHKTWWGKKGKTMPQELALALKSDDFHTQAFKGSAAYNFADVPVTKPANATFAMAMLQARQQDIGLPVPSYLVVAVVRADRVFVWNVAAKDMKAIAACDAIFNAATGKFNAMAEAYQRTGKKTDAAIEVASRAQDAADVETRKCYGARAKDQPFFADVVKQAQDLVDRLK